MTTQGDRTTGGAPDAGGPVFTVAAVARRLGMAPATLRTWDRRYGLGPSCRSVGSHRRYDHEDVERLLAVCALIRDGMTPADAARLVLSESPPGVTPADVSPNDPRRADAAPEATTPTAPTTASEPDVTSTTAARRAAAAWSNERGPERIPGRRPRTGDVAQVSSPGFPLFTPAPDHKLGQVLPAATVHLRSEPGPEVDRARLRDLSRRLSRAAMALDAAEAARLFADGIAAYGTVRAWCDLAVPVLRAIGQRWETLGDVVDVEHTLSEALIGVLRHGVTASRPSPGAPKVMLACADGETHSLPLHALAAALAERHCPVHHLGIGLPVSSLATAVRRTGPGVVFVFARMPVADLTVVELVRRQRPAPRVVLGGPGWVDLRPGPAVRVVTDLPAAVEEVLDALG